MHRALSQCQKKSGDALFDALHIFDALVHILETIVWTKITKMQFWLQSTLCWIKLFPRDCNSFSAFRGKCTDCILLSGCFFGAVLRRH